MNISENIETQSTSDIIRQLGKQYSVYRKRMGYTQKQVSGQSGLSIFTISSFENGSTTGITFASFIKLLRAIHCIEEINKLLPELPESPRALFLKQQKTNNKGKGDQFGESKISGNNHRSSVLRQKKQS